MGEMLSRPGMEDLLDRNVYKTGAESGRMYDIWDGQVLRNFTDPNGEPFVGERKGSEGCYIFALNMDGFNPFYNKKGGGTSGCGAVYMVCLNLPPHLRYRLENMFLVSIIPGLNHPSLVQINHLLKPLVDDLIQFWDSGVYYSRTHNFQKGRHVRCTLVPVICDLPAARQMMAFAAHSSNHFCCYCGLLATEMDNLDINTWPPGINTREKWVDIATRWKEALTKERLRLFNKYSIRYSELLRLPYWDPTRFVVIDSMHSFFLTALRHHCRELWGMDITAHDGDGTRSGPKQSKEPDARQMETTWKTVRHGTDSMLDKLNRNVLRDLCQEAALPTGGHKAKLVGQLRKYVSGTSIVG